MVASVLLLQRERERVTNMGFCNDIGKTEKNSFHSTHQEKVF